MMVIYRASTLKNLATWSPVNASTAQTHDEIPGAVAAKRFGKYGFFITHLQLVNSQHTNLALLLVRICYIRVLLLL